MRRAALLLAWTLTGAAAGSGAVLALGQALSEGPPRVAGPAPEAFRGPAGPAPLSRLPHARPRVLLAWAVGGLPPGAESVVKRLPGIRAAATVEAGLDWIRAVRGPGGARLERPPRGLWIPFENAYVDPAEYAAFVPPGERAALRALAPGEVLLAESAAMLRGGDAGLELDVGHSRLRVTGTLPDVLTGGYEAVTAGRAPAGWRVVDRFLLMRVSPGLRRARVARRLRALAGGAPVQLRLQGETPFLRHGDAVLPQLLLKRTFGEFAAHPLPDGTLMVDPAWRRANIVTRRVPLLGEVTCHRAVVPQLRAALRELRARGLSHTLDPGSYGGCYAPRTVNSIPGNRLSHHSWGIAFDVNVSKNAYGTQPDLDRRVVEVLEDYGFTWGGDWQVPDGMHFEWWRFP